VIVRAEDGGLGPIENGKAFVHADMHSPPTRLKPK
jgi:hypothetical protein